MEYSNLFDKKGEKPQFSFIIPTFNRYELVTRAINSIRNLKLNIPFEIVIVDNNSEEEISKKLVKYLKKESWDKNVSINYYYYYFNNGMYKNWNNGILHSKCDYFTILNDDDILCEGFVKLVKKVLKNKPKEAVCGSISYWDGNDKLKFKKKTLLKEILFKILTFFNFNLKYNITRGIDGNPIPGTLGAILNKNIINEIGYYDPNFGIAADYDFNTRCLISFGIKRYFFPVALYYINENTSSTIFTTNKFINESYNVRFRILTRLKYTEEEILKILYIKQSLFVYEHSKLFGIDIHSYTDLIKKFELKMLNSSQYNLFKLKLFFLINYYPFKRFLQ